MTLEATILKGVGGLYTARLDAEYEGKREINIRARGAFRHENTVLLPGDRVEIEPVIANEFFCKKIIDRKNSLIRPPVANLEYLFIAVSCKKPLPSLQVVDKIISIAEHNGIEPIIVITKKDLDKEKCNELSDIYKKCGFVTFETSSSDCDGVKEFYTYIKDTVARSGAVCAFCGASGAGKSTLINTVFPSLQLETGGLSRKTERGKNTTRCVELFPFEKIMGEGYSGYLADTPGFSLLDFERFDFFSLPDLFSSFREFAPSFGKCRYTKCTHTKEEGCDVIRRVKCGEIPKSRHDSYVSLYETLKKKPDWKK